MTRADGELTTSQVADYLGVKVQTVYAYVSRGVLRPVRRDASRGSLFALAEVEAVVDGGRAGRRRPGTSEDVRTSITEVRGGSLAYRGHDVGELVGRATFEEVRALLTGHPGEADPLPSVEERAVLTGVLDALPPGSGPLDRFKHAVLLAGATDPGRQDRSPQAFAHAGRRAATWMGLSLPGRAAGLAAEEAAEVPPDGRGTGGGDQGEVPAPHTAALGTLLGRALAPCPVRVLDAALVLLADHDLAVSTTAVRVAVSSGADPYGALLAGLAAADSPRHMTASLQVVDWLSTAVVEPQQALDAALARGRPAGFGHPVYTEQDPRAQALVGVLAPDCPPARLEALRWLQDELGRRRGWVLNVDVGLALMVLTYGLPRWAGAAVFACARTAGWTAHALEELDEPGMRFRLRGVYTGPHG